MVWVSVCVCGWAVYGCVRVYVGRVGYVCELVSVDVLGMSGCVDKLVMCVCVCPWMG